MPPMAGRVSSPPSASSTMTLRPLSPYVQLRMARKPRRPPKPRFVASSWRATFRCGRLRTARGRGRSPAQHAPAFSASVSTGHHLGFTQRTLKITAESPRRRSSFTQSWRHASCSSAPRPVCDRGPPAGRPGNRHARTGARGHVHACRLTGYRSWCTTIGSCAVALGPLSPARKP